MKSIVIFIFLLLFVFCSNDASGPDTDDTGDAGIDTSWDWDVSIDIPEYDIPATDTGLDTGPQDTGLDADIGADTLQPCTLHQPAINPNGTTYYVNSVGGPSYTFQQISEDAGYYNLTPPDFPKEIDPARGYIGGNCNGATYNQHIYKINLSQDSYISAFTSGADLEVYLVQGDAASTCAIAGNDYLNQNTKACSHLTAGSKKFEDDGDFNFCVNSECHNWWEVCYCEENFLEIKKEWLGWWATVSNGTSWYVVVDNKIPQPVNYDLKLVVQQSCEFHETIQFNGSALALNGSSVKEYSNVAWGHPKAQVASWLKERCGVDETEVTEHIYFLEITGSSQQRFSIKAEIWEDWQTSKTEGVLIITKAFEPKPGTFICYAPILALAEKEDGHLLKCAYDSVTVKAEGLQASGQYDYLPPGKYYVIVTGEDASDPGEYDLKITLSRKK